MKSYQVGDRVKVRRSGQHGQIVMVSYDRFEVHIKDGSKLSINPCFKEYELEHSKGGC